MERAKLANGKKTESVNTKSARTPMKKTGSKPKAEKLVCRYVEATIWPRALSSDAIAGVGSVSANAMDRRHLRRIRGARSSSKGCDEGSGAHTLGPFFCRVTVSAGPVPSLPKEVARGFEMTGSFAGWFRGPGIDRLGAGRGD